MEHDDALKKSLIDALKSSNYEVYIEEPNNVDLCTDKEGSKYLLIRGDDAKFGVSYGECTVTILGHAFTCDLEWGEWSADEEEDSWLLDDYKFIKVLESADGVISGCQTDPDEQGMVYCRANGISENLPAYMYDSDDLPEDEDEEEEDDDEEEDEDD